MKKIVMATVALSFMTACGGGGSSTPSSLNPMNQVNRMIEFQRYMITVTPNSKSFPFNMCSVIKGFMVINNNVATGTIFSLTNKPYIVSGRYIPDTGAIDGAFTDNDDNIAPYTGIFNSEKGSGTWSDDFNCIGTWIALKKK